VATNEAHTEVSDAVASVPGLSLDEEHFVDSGGPAFWRHTTRVIHTVSRAFAVASALGLVVLVLATVADVVKRNLFGASLNGTVELSTLILVGIAALSLPYAERTRTHVRVGLVADRLSPRVGGIVEALGGIAISLLLIWLIDATADRAQQSIELNEETIGIVAIAVWPVRVLLTLSLFWLLLEWVVNIVDSIRQAVSGERPHARGRQAGDAA
jgi:TRAP-type C4-dicarboxylate transport system permease small subunit